MTIIINGALSIKKTDPLASDDYGDLETIAIKLFKKLVEGDNDPKLDAEDYRILADRGYMDVPLKKYNDTSVTAGQYYPFFR